MSFNETLLLEIDHVKYRKAGEGRSPIGRLLLYSEHVEWRDNTSTDVLHIKFIRIKGQRVSAATKPKVQLQVCLHNEDQATFVFLDTSKTKEQLLEQRDTMKEALQQSLIDHRAKVNQLAASQEQSSVTAELEAKQRLLHQNKQLYMLYEHLVASKLITPQDFWLEYYKPQSSDVKTGTSGAFLANIAQQEGAKGVKLNLNAEIIQAIFNTYPAVERKHLELVPHEMKEEEFWSKFFQSHYYHREREVIPNPSDPFANCVKIDDAEMEKMFKEGVKRRRFDLDHLSDNLMDDNPKSENSKGAGKTTLVRRCNYLSEKIVASLKTGDGTAKKDDKKSGFDILNRIIDDEENRLESEDLHATSTVSNTTNVKISSGGPGTVKKIPLEDANRYKSIVLRCLDGSNDEDILLSDLQHHDDISNGTDQLTNGKDDGGSSSWDFSPQELAEIRSVHDACCEILKHFWSCFPPVTPELEEKMDRMHQAYTVFEEGQLSKMTMKYGPQSVEHCYNMIGKARQRYQAVITKRKK